MTAPTQLADGVLVVNLDERTDRWQQILQDVAPQLAPLLPVRLSAVKGVLVDGFGKPPYFRGRKRDKTWAGRAGCTLSHRAAIAHAAAAGWRSVLILEDDVELTDSFRKIVAGLPDALAGIDWGVCYLGFTDPVGPFGKITPLSDTHDLFQLYGCNTTHAYLVHEPAYAFLLSALPDEKAVWHWLTQHRAIDRWYARTLSRHMRVLAVSPSVVNQRDGVSDITGRNFESPHNTAIPEANNLATVHAAGRLLRSLIFMFSGLVDSARGAIRRRFGF